MARGSCSPRGAWAVPAVPEDVGTKNAKISTNHTTHRINTKSFIHNGGRWIINPQQIPTGDFFVGKASIRGILNLYAIVWQNVQHLSATATHSAAFTWQYCHSLRHWRFWLKSSAATGCKKCLAKSLRLFKGTGGIGHIGRQHKNQLTTQCFDYLWLYPFWICHCTPHLAMMFGIHSIRWGFSIPRYLLVTSWYLYPSQSKNKQTVNLKYRYVYLKPHHETGQITSPTLPPIAVGLHNTTTSPPQISCELCPRYCQQEALQWKDAFEPQVMFITTVGNTSLKSQAKNWRRCMQHNDLPCKFDLRSHFSKSSCHGSIGKVPGRERKGKGSFKKWFGLGHCMV